MAALEPAERAASAAAPVGWRSAVEEAARLARRVVGPDRRAVDGHVHARRANRVTLPRVATTDERRTGRDRRARSSTGSRAPRRGAARRRRACRRAAARRGQAARARAGASGSSTPARSSSSTATSATASRVRDARAAALRRRGRDRLRDDLRPARSSSSRRTSRSSAAACRRSSPRRSARSWTWPRSSAAR